MNSTNILPRYEQILISHLGQISAAKYRRILRSTMYGGGKLNQKKNKEIYEGNGGQNLTEESEIEGPFSGLNRRE